MKLRERWNEICSNQLGWIDRITTLGEHLHLEEEDTVRTLLRNGLVSTSDLIALQEEYERLRGELVSEFSAAAGLGEIDTSPNTHDVKDLIDNYLLSGEMKVDQLFE